MKKIFIILITIIFYFHFIISKILPKIINEDIDIDINDIILNFPINITLYKETSFLKTSFTAFYFSSNSNTNLLLSIQNQFLNSGKLYIYKNKNISYDEINDEFSDFTIKSEIKNYNLQIEKDIEYYIIFQNKEQDNNFIVFFYDLNENIQLFYGNNIINPFCLTISDFDFKNLTFYLPKELNNFYKLLIQFNINDTDVNGSIFINDILKVDDYNIFSDYLDIYNNTDLKIVYGKTNEEEINSITTEICFSLLNNIYYEISEIKIEYPFNFINKGDYYFFSNLTYSISYNKNISFIIHSLKPLKKEDFELTCYFANDNEILENKIDLDSIKCNLIEDLYNDFHIFFNSFDNNNKTNFVFKLNLKNDMENTLTFIKSGLIENLNFDNNVSYSFNTTGNLVPKIFVLNLEELFNENKEIMIFNNNSDFLRICKGDLVNDNINFSDFKQIEVYKKDLYNKNDSKIINVMIYNNNNSDKLNEILFYASNKTKLFYLQKDDLKGNYRIKINLKNCYKEKVYFLSKYKDISKSNNYLIYFDVFYGEGNVYYQKEIQLKPGMNITDIFFNENSENINSKFISENNIDIIGINCTSSLLGYLNIYNKNNDITVLNPGKSNVYYIKDKKEYETVQSDLNFSIILLGNNEQKLKYSISDELINELSNENHIEKNTLKKGEKLSITCESNECLYQLNVGNNNISEIKIIDSNENLVDVEEKIYVVLKNKSENYNISGYNVYIDADNNTEICLSETYGTEGYISEDSNNKCFIIDNNNNENYYLLNISSPFFLYQSENFKQKNFMENDDYYFILYKKSGNINSMNFSQTFVKEWKNIDMDKDIIINNENNLINLSNSNNNDSKIFVQISKCNELNEINFNVYENDYYIEDNNLNNNDNYLIYYNQKTTTQFEFNKNNEILFRYNSLSDDDNCTYEFTDDFKVFLDGNKLKFFKMLKFENSNYEIIITNKKNEKYLNSLCDINKLIKKNKTDFLIIKHEDKNDDEINIIKLDENKIKKIDSELAIAVIGIKKGNFKIKKLYKNVVHYEEKKGLSGFVIFLIIFVILLVIIIIGFYIYKKCKVKFKPIEQKDILNEFQTQSQTLTQ